MNFEQVAQKHIFSEFILSWFFFLNKKAELMKFRLWLLDTKLATGTILQLEQRIDKSFHYQNFFNQLLISSSGINYHLPIAILAWKGCELYKYIIHLAYVLLWGTYIYLVISSYAALYTIVKIPLCNITSSPSI